MHTHTGIRGSDMTFVPFLLISSHSLPHKFLRSTSEGSGKLLLKKNISLNERRTSTHVIDPSNHLKGLAVISSASPSAKMLFVGDQKKMMLSSSPIGRDSHPLSSTTTESLSTCSSSSSLNNSSMGGGIGGEEEEEKGVAAASCSTSFPSVNADMNRAAVLRRSQSEKVYLTSSKMTSLDGLKVQCPAINATLRYVCINICK